MPAVDEFTNSAPQFFLDLSLSLDATSDIFDILQSSQEP